MGFNNFRNCRSHRYENLIGENLFYFKNYFSGCVIRIAFDIIYLNNLSIYDDFYEFGRATAKGKIFQDILLNILQLFSFIILKLLSQYFFSALLTC